MSWGLAIYITFSLIFIYMGFRFLEKMEELIRECKLTRAALRPPKEERSDFAVASGWMQLAGHALSTIYAGENVLLNPENGSVAPAPRVHDAGRVQ